MLCKLLSTAEIGQQELYLKPSRQDKPRVSIHPETPIVALIDDEDSPDGGYAYPPPLTFGGGDFAAGGLFQDVDFHFVVPRMVLD